MSITTISSYRPLFAANMSDTDNHQAPAAENQRQQEVGVKPARRPCRLPTPEAKARGFKLL